MNGRIFATNGSPRGTIWNFRGKTLPLFIINKTRIYFNTASVSLYAIAQSVRNHSPVRRAPCRGRPFVPSGGDQRRVGADAADDRADRADLPKTGPECGVHRSQRDRRQCDRLPAGYGRCAADRAVIARSARGACRFDLHHHRDPGLEYRVVYQVVSPRRRHGEPLLGLDAPHRVTAAGRGGDFRAEAGLCRTFHLALLFHRPPLPHGRLAGFELRGIDYPAVRQYHLCPAYAQA